MSAGWQEKLCSDLEGYALGYKAEGTKTSRDSRKCGALQGWLLLLTERRRQILRTNLLS